MEYATAEAGLELAVRSSATATGHATVDDGILLDLAPMNGLLTDPEAKPPWPSRASPSVTAHPWAPLTKTYAAHRLFM